MRFKTFLKLSVLVVSQLFSLYIVFFVGMAIGWSCSKTICQDISFWWYVGGLIITIIFHTYLAFRVGTGSRRNGQTQRTWEQKW